MIIKTEILNTKKIKLSVKIMIIFIMANIYIYSYTKHNR